MKPPARAEESPPNLQTAITPGGCARHCACTNSGVTTWAGHELCSAPEPERLDVSDLPGILSRPKEGGPFPAVVLVHGSGPNDKDETFGPNKPFRDLAWGLAERGIAVLRYDKRTKVHPEQFRGNFTVKEETLDDALAAVNTLRETNPINSKRIYVLGHSLGGMLIPRIGKADPNIAGLIVMAGTTRPLEDVIVEQMRYLGGNVPAAKTQADKIKSLKPGDDPVAGLPRELLARSSQLQSA